MSRAKDLAEKLRDLADDYACVSATGGQGGYDTTPLDAALAELVCLAEQAERERDTLGDKG